MAIGAIHAGGFFRTASARDARRAGQHRALLRRHDRRHAAPVLRLHRRLTLLRPESRGHVRIKSADPRPRRRSSRTTSRRDATATCIVCGHEDPAADLRDAGDAPSYRCRIRARAGLRRATPISLTTSGGAARRSIIRPRPAAWAATRPPSSMRACACAASKAYAWSTPRSCRRWCPATPTRPTIMIAEKGADMILADAAAASRPAAA